MKAFIETVEWYPVRMLSPWPDGADVPDALVARYEAALVEWRAVQGELRKLDESAHLDDDNAPEPAIGGLKNA